MSERSTLPFIRPVAFFRVNVPSSFGHLPPAEARVRTSTWQGHDPREKATLLGSFYPSSKGGFTSVCQLDEARARTHHPDHASLLLRPPSSRRIKKRLRCFIDDSASFPSFSASSLSAFRFDALLSLQLQILM